MNCHENAKEKDAKVKTLIAKVLCFLHVCTSYLGRKLNMMQTEESNQPMPRKHETDFLGPLLAYVSPSMAIFVWWVAVFKSKVEELSIGKHP